MIKVLVYGDDTDSTGLQLYEALSAVFRITYISGTRFYDCGKTPELLLVETDRKLQCNFQDGIILFKRMSVPVEVDRCFCAIAASDNIQALQALKNANCRVITCGMSIRDTLTLSSAGERATAVSLQRGIHTLSGVVEESRELLLRLRRARPPYTVLAAAALLLLCGRAEEETAL